MLFADCQVEASAAHVKRKAYTAGDKFSVRSKNGFQFQGKLWLSAGILSLSLSVINTIQ